MQTVVQCSLGHHYQKARDRQITLQGCHDLILTFHAFGGSFVKFSPSLISCQL
jgi:hypothetical protein